ncbi:protein of unknown function [Trichlorobacter ammonificans]|uniref:Uncharacterized protein n=1 Tax=Trichlorobacter ammonificans TaxID=2916410 RepID=A0ABM9D7N8_9BACT|nr:protein of unknown function [Trichlorobacter ammonificans]
MGRALLEIKEVVTTVRIVSIHARPLGRALPV